MKKNRFGYDNITSLLGSGTPFNCRFKGGGGIQAPQQADNTMQMMAMFREQADIQEARFQAMESARMETMMQMEQMRLVHEEKLREQMKRADIEAERLLREETLDAVQESEAVAIQQEAETPEGLTIDWMSALQHGMTGEDYYPE
tara:strand:+ start:496 stop:930 length:435 start_codon:yes stop_codon:yes gene_type:complete